MFHALMSFAIAGLLLSPQTSRTTEVAFNSHDNQKMLGKLTLPDTNGRYPIIIYVQTAEGATVDQKRPNGRGGTFNYFDLYRERLPEMKFAFFSYEGRGIRMGDSPPRYEHIDWDVYNTSTLENKVRDILSAVQTVKRQSGVDPSRIYLMGTSEGTMLAAEAASRAPEDIKGLILYSVMSSTLKDALAYMAADGAFTRIREIFDGDKDGKVSKQELTADERRVRAAGLNGVTFEQLDENRDGSFAIEDFRRLRKDLLDGIEAENVAPIYGWLKLTAGVSIPDKWIEDHFAHPAMWTFLDTLKMPIGLFHAGGDTNTPIAGVKKLEERAKAAGKANMRFHYVEGLDHSLGIGRYLAVGGELPAGHKAIFEYIRTLQ